MNNSCEVCVVHGGIIISGLIIRALTRRHSLNFRVNKLHENIMRIVPFYIPHHICVIHCLGPFYLPIYPLYVDHNYLRPTPFEVMQHMRVLFVILLMDLLTNAFRVMVKQISIRF